MPTENEKKNPVQNNDPEDQEEFEDEEDEEEEEEDIQEPPRTEFMNMVEALESAMQNLTRMPQLNPQSIRLHLQNDLYPILIDFARACDWYTGDLHRRVTDVEEEVNESPEEALSPEFAEQLIEFIGISLQLFSVLVNACKNDVAVIEKVQLLIAQAPGIITRIREVTMVEEDEEEEDEEEEDEISEVLEPRAAKPPAETPAPVEPEQKPVDEMVVPVSPPPMPTNGDSADMPVVTTTDVPSADVPAVAPTNGGTETTNG